MFAPKEQNPQRPAVVPSQPTTKTPHRAQPAQLVQRYLGNAYLQAATTNSPSLIQRACGCGGTCASCSGKSSGLTVGPANDAYEQEADRVADAVMRMPDPALQRQEEEEDMLQPKLIQRQEEEEELMPKRIQRQEQEEEEALQLKPLSAQITPLVQRQEEEEGLMPKRLQRQADAEGSAEAPAIARDVIQSSGQPLDASTRAYMEPRFEYDFGGVRVHTGSQATEAARSVSARAYTAGQHVVFGSGQYAPGTDEGKRLLAHELTHVVQQNGR